MVMSEVKIIIVITAIHSLMSQYRTGPATDAFCTLHILHQSYKTGLIKLNFTEKSQKLLELELGNVPELIGRVNDRAGTQLLV